MEFKGTKGEWKVGVAFQGETDNIKIKTNGQLLVIEDIDGKAVAILGRIMEVEQESNAKLIAVAPEMLKMLERCSHWIANCSEEANIIKDIEQLIKKATL